MESSTKLTPTGRFRGKRPKSPTRRDRHHSRFRKRQKKLNSDAESKTLIPKLLSDSTCSGKLTPCRSLEEKKVWSKRKREERKTRNVYGNRKWTESHKNTFMFKDRFVVVSYNILGAENVRKHPELYYHIPHKFLDWNYRKKKICKEISYYHASIICFQEVDRFKELDVILQEDGFEGIYKGRTGEASDGCAIFWKQDLFTLLHKENIEFQMFGLRDNIAQLCVLKMNEARTHSCVSTDPSQASSPRAQSVVVGNIHILFNPKRGDIKLGQVRMFVEKAHQLSEVWGNIPIILSGDFNCLAKSAMYQYLSSSELDVRLHDRRNISGQTNYHSQCRSVQSVHYNRNGFWKVVQQPSLYDWSREELSFATGCEEITHLDHKLNLTSAYTGIPGTLKTRDEHGEPLVTVYSQCGTVDYIWHTEDLLPLKILETLPISDMEEIGGLPSKDWGSDHLAIACEFAFLNKTGSSVVKKMIDKSVNPTSTTS